MLNVIVINQDINILILEDLILLVRERKNNPIEGSVDIEGQVKNYIENILKNHFSKPSAIVDEPIDNDPFINDIEDDDMAMKINESSLDYKEIINGFILSTYSLELAS